MDPKLSLAFHQAIEAGDLKAIRALLGDPPNFPNGQLPYEITIFEEYCLDHAIVHGPLSLVKELLELGADPNYPGNGFPSLFSALDSPQPDRHERLKLLLDYGADIQQRGVNDYTPLHQAACMDDAAAVEILLQRGADPNARTRIDECATPLEEAEYLGRVRGAEALRRLVGLRSE
ncbi:ankyrin repeat domain-containing protein [Microvirga arsenatis]|uniref:Ankyrin repeat domain-containing protein n=1 Tax=Microvirga arsenatis TaxID=2692265 RepID=A0ABW9YRL4_9HYPH|nr:ankyrin repeat domain-containing protein [Microvirga arsenatis]NBJ09798.1 ankyrin repeat domain-containing protein [Microvirga arsenatis]NBJ22867.1 ankyrin repeat domain-containing protein [Microvirga arsenatis]